MSKPLKKILLIASVFLLFSEIQAQNNTYSPYSRFGIGDISKNVLGRHQAMGGVGLGIRDRNNLNYLNPAAASAQDTNSFIFSTGITGNAMRLESIQGNHDVSNITLSHLAIGFPVSRWWKTNIGLVPFSQVGYNIVDVELRQGTEHSYEGSGGINRFFIGNAVNLTSNFSAGVSISYLFGSLTRSARLDFPLTEDQYPVSTVERSKVGDFHLRYGLQYYNRIGNRYSYTLGVIYENKSLINSDQDRLIIRELTTDAGQKRDTIQHLHGEVSHFELPSNIGFGATFSRDNKFTIGADYSFQNWAETTFEDQRMGSIVNSSSLNFGAQYIPDHSSTRNYLNRINYRLGFHYSDTYLQLRGHQLKDYGFTFGLGLPYGNANSSFNFSVDIGRRGTTDFNLIRENYIMFNFSFSLYDYWFFQRRYD
jgi:hypothetical protein